MTNSAAYTATWRLLGIGLITGAVYLLRLATPMTLREYLSQPLADLPLILGATPVAAWYYVDTILILYALYVWGYLIVKRWSSSDMALTIALMPIVFSVTLILMFPVTAGDVFNYIFFGRIWVYEGLNPYLVTPNMRPNDITVPYAVFRDFATVYGALFTHVSAFLVWIAGQSLLANLLAFKGAMAVFHALTTLFVYLTLRGTQPRLALAGAFLIFWNPLVLFNAAADGHNDVAMLAVVAAALYLASRGRWALAGIAFALSISMKWTSVILLPVFVVAAVRTLGVRRLPVIVGSVAVGLGLDLLLHAPFYEGPASLLGSVPEVGQMLTASVAYVLRDVLLRVLDANRAERAARVIVYALFAAFYIRELIRIRGGFQSLVYACYQALFLYLIFGSVWFQPWYVTWIVGLGALLVGTATAWRTILFTCSAMLIHAVLGFGWRMEWFGGSRPLIQLAAVAVALLPPILAWIIEEVLGETPASRPLHAPEAAPLGQ